MRLSDRDLCAVLLGSSLALSGEEQGRPLTARRFSQLLDALKNAGGRPEDLLSDTDAENLLQALGLDSEDRTGIGSLLSRKDSALKELEDLGKRGIHVMTLFDPEYPRMLRRKLKKTQLPPLFYYAGDPKLANMVGIGVTGSRRLDDAGRRFTERLAEKAAEEKLVIFSGGARGTDRTAEMTAACTGGAYVSYLAEPLLKQIRKQDISQDAACGKGLFLSDEAPDEPFTAGHALCRNKYIYASGMAAIAVEADLQRGGTWDGALYSIVHGLTRTFIWDNKDFPGNQELIRRGGIPYDPAEDRPLADLLELPEMMKDLPKTPEGLTERSKKQPERQERQPGQGAGKSEAGWHQMSLKEFGMM